MRVRPSRSLVSEQRLKQARYVLSSGASVIVGQAVLAFTFGVLGWEAAPANVVSFVVAGVVAYVLHRRWTWRRSGRSGLARELLPYWGIAMVSLVLSTWLVDVVAREAAGAQVAHAVATLMVMGTALLVNGVFWVVKFVVFDRWLFADRA
jgi:putative flippase GtrA